MPLQLLLVLIGVSVVMVLGMIITISRFYQKVNQGQALIINRVQNINVSFTGAIVLPVFHRAEIMDISTKKIEIKLGGGDPDGLVCADNVRAEIVVVFFVRVNKTKEDVLRVAQSVGCERTFDQQALEDLFSAKFSSAVKIVGRKLEFEQLYSQREEFTDEILNVIGRDLNGYVLDDAAISHIDRAN